MQNQRNPRKTFKSQESLKDDILHLIEGQGQSYYKSLMQHDVSHAQGSSGKLLKNITSSRSKSQVVSEEFEDKNRVSQRHESANNRALHNQMRNSPVRKNQNLFKEKNQKIESKFTCKTEETSNTPDKQTQLSEMTFQLSSDSNKNSKNQKSSDKKNQVVGQQNRDLMKTGPQNGQFLVSISMIPQLSQSPNSSANTEKQIISHLKDEKEKQFSINQMGQKQEKYTENYGRKSQSQFIKFKTNDNLKQTQNNQQKKPLIKISSYRSHIKNFAHREHYCESKNKTKKFKNKEQQRMDSPIKLQKQFPHQNIFNVKKRSQFNLPAIDNPKVEQKPQKLANINQENQNSAKQLQNLELLKIKAKLNAKKAENTMKNAEKEKERALKKAEKEKERALKKAEEERERALKKADEERERALKQKTQAEIYIGDIDQRIKKVKLEIYQKIENPCNSPANESL